MSEWYYSKDGAQLGPVSEAEIRQMLAGGSLDPQKSLVWKSGMADWLPAANVPELAATTVSAADPYAAPASGFGEVVALPDPGAPLPEIQPGSEKFDPMACFKRGFDLAVRHIGLVLLAMIIWVVISIAAEMVLGGMDRALGWGVSEPITFDDGTSFQLQSTGSALNMILSNVLSIFLSLGISRLMLNIVSGREAAVGQLFGEGRLLLRGVLASLIFFVMVALGLLLLIVPGIYLIARYGFFMTALVDRNCGILESFRISSTLTTNNRLNVVLLMLGSLVIGILGLLALCVGLLFAYPVVILAWVVAFRWMQYGYRAAMDHPGTSTPMLTPVRG